MSLKSRFKAVKHGTLNYRVVISFALPDVHNIWCCSSSRPGTQRCFEDVIILCSNEDNPQVTDPVRVIATIIFQLSLGTYQKHRGATTRAIDLRHRYANTIRTKFMINSSSINRITSELPLSRHPSSHLNDHVIHIN